MKAYRWHDRLSILANDVTERHLCALVRVRPDLWMVDVLNLLDGDCTTLVVTFKLSENHTPVLNADSCDAHSSVGSHLHRSESTAFVALLPQLRCPVCGA